MADLTTYESHCTARTVWFSIDAWARICVGLIYTHFTIIHSVSSVLLYAFQCYRTTQDIEKSETHTDTRNGLILYKHTVRMYSC